MNSEHGHPPLDEPSSAGDRDAMFASRGCCCFWVPWSSSAARPSDYWDRGLPPPLDSGGGWLKRGIMKIREWSELVAGPRWKTFIRRFNRNPHLGGGGSGGRRWKKFQYDPLSYALNFDDGRGEDESPDRDAAFRDFSSRFAAIPVSAKTSMDLGGRDDPPLFNVSATAAGH